MNNAKLINQDSGDFEYYTPKFIIEAAREVMGSIDLDPSSTFAANQHVLATSYMTEEMDGLSKSWFGNVLLNHPFSRSNNPLWINKLISERRLGHITQSCNITFAATSEAWFQPLLQKPQCFLHPRTNYYTPDGKKKTGVTKGSVVTYIGWNDKKFKEIFSEFGIVK